MVILRIVEEVQSMVKAGKVEMYFAKRIETTETLAP
jgi:hypothetical protein